MSNYLQWKKSGRSECGKYQASGRGAFHFHDGGTVNLGAEESAAENRAICQRHAWAIRSQQAINEACLYLTTATQTGAAKISHALPVDSSQVSRWKLGRALVPAKRCEALTAMLPARICANLRPDLEFYSDAKTNDFKWRKRSAIEGGAES